MLHEDDHELVRRSLDDPRAFDALFDRHFASVHRYARHCLDVQAADDVASETFLRAFASRGRYAPSTPDARAWLFAIALNLVRDEVRRRGRLGGLRERLSVLHPASPLVEACADVDGADPQLREALRGLREQDREVLLLFAWAELSYEEIAEATQTAVGTVRSRLSRARTRLRAQIEAPREPAPERTR